STGEPVTPWMEHRDALRFAGFSPDATHMLTYGESRNAQIWDARNGRQSAGPLAHPDRILDAAWSPDGRRVITACSGSVAYLWDATTGERLFTLRHSNEVRAVAFSPD